MPRRHALLIGVESCPAADLQGPGNDVALMRDVVCSRFGLDARVIPNHEATRDGILSALDALVSSAEPNDTLLFYFAGHGTRIEQVEDEEELVREALCPHDFAREDHSRAIRDFELHERFAKAQCRGARLTAIFDCCFSGGLAEEDVRRALAREARENLGGLGDDLADVIEGPQIRRILPQPCVADRLRSAVSQPAETRPLFRISEIAAVRSGGPTTVIFGACLADALAREQRFGDEIHGVFTHHLTDVLCGTDPGITNLAVRDAVREAVRLASEDADDIQRAILAPSDQGGLAFLA
ncbi:MAG: caspase family protein [Myxococcales bacterium]|nr:caspase family protein [Myxococcales bacterium]